MIFGLFKWTRKEVTKMETRQTKRERYFRTKKGFVYLSRVILLLGILFSFDAKSVPAQSFKPPEMIKLTTYDIGATGYVMYGYLGEAMAEKFGTKLRAIPVGNDIARMIPVRGKQAQFAGQGGDIYYASEGLDRYADIAWGPQPLRVVWLARQPGHVGIVRGDSGIKTCADLKGKRLPWIPGSVFNLFHETLLAFANLTWDDVTKVQVSGFGAMMRALVDGKIDVAMAAITVPPARELQASPHGVGFIPLPASDKEGWARMLKIVPYYTPYKAVFGPGVSEANPVECTSYAYPGTVCYDFLDGDTAYFMTRAIHESYPSMAKKSELMKRFWSLKECLDLFEVSRGYIFHPGSVRYLKEIKAWRPGWDELQQKRLEHQKGLAALWDKTMAEAQEKKIKAGDFAAFWLKKHNESFGGLPD
jgi:TRAP transporter TAXI family solute receptor